MTSDSPGPVGSSRDLAAWFLAYLVAAAAGHVISAFVMSPLPLSLSAGVALAAALTAGTRIWPAIMGAAFLLLVFAVRDAGSGPVMLVLASLGGAAGITLGATTAAGVVRRLVKDETPFGRISDYLVYVGFGAILSGLIAGSIVTACFGVAGLNDHYVGVWRSWLVADLLGAMTFTPVILVWLAAPDGDMPRNKMLEAALLTAVIGLLSLVALGPLSEFVGPVASHPLILALPLAWGALRFGDRGTASWVLVVSLLAIWGTGAGYSAFNTGAAENPLQAVQFMIFVVAGTTFMIRALSGAQQSIERELVEANQRLGARVNERTQALKESEERRGNLTTTDDLTGASNRSYFLEMSKMEFYRARRYQRPLAVIMIDGDRFKSINDTHGHAVGDLVLRELTHTCQNVLRASDIFGRIGGEEFAATLPDTGAEGATEVAERLRQAVEDSEVQIEDGAVKMTISIGVAVISDETIEYENLLKHADDALYRAKEGGRNMVVAHQP